MSERLTEDIIEKFKTYEIPEVKSKIRKKNLVKFAESINAKKEKYFGDNPVAHPAYVGTIVVKALLSLGDAAVKDKDGNDVKLILNPLKIVHGGQNYKFSDVPVKDGEMIFTTGTLKEVYIKSGMLFLVASCTTKNETGDVVLETEINAICREGGF